MDHSIPVSIPVKKARKGLEIPFLHWLYAHPGAAFGARVRAIPAAYAQAALMPAFPGLLEGPIGADGGCSSLGHGTLSQDLFGDVAVNQRAGSDPCHPAQPADRAACVISLYGCEWQQAWQATSIQQDSDSRGRAVSSGTP